MNHSKLPEPGRTASEARERLRAALQRIPAAADALAELELGAGAGVVSRKLGQPAPPPAQLTTAAHAFAREHAPSNRRERRTAARSERAAPAPSRYMQELQSAHRKQIEWERAHRRRMAKLGFRAGLEGAAAQRFGWSRRAWIFVREAQWDPSSRRIRIELDRIRARSPAFAGAVTRAALELLPDGRARRRWTSPRARAVAMLLIAMWKDAIPTRRGGSHRRLFRGVTHASMCALLEHAGERPHRNTVGGSRHRKGATLEHAGAQLGYLLAAEEAGALYAQQLPPECVTPAERWIVQRKNKAGQRVTIEVASNQYWITCAHPADLRLTQSARERAAELAVLGEPIDSALVEVLTRRAERRELELQLLASVQARPPPAPD